MVVPTGQLAASSRPLLEIVERSPFALPPLLFAGITLIAVSNGALINLVMASRVIYGMADQGVLPAVFSSVHPSRLTP
jgi:APA family basic amino acid/polyamine antiporter